MCANTGTGRQQGIVRGTLEIRLPLTAGKEEPMSKEEYIKHITDALKEIDNGETLNRILNYVMKHMVREKA